MEAACSEIEFCGQDSQAGLDVADPIWTSERFVSNGDGTVLDTRTALLWQESPGELMQWTEAIEACHDLELAGHTDWHLPDRFELISLLNYGRHEPASDFPHR